MSNVEVNELISVLEEIRQEKYPEIPAGIREKKEITPELDELLAKAINECKAQR